MESKISNVLDQEMNLLLITIDCWRFDHFTQQLAPNIFTFSQDAFRFDSVFANGPWTAPSVSSFLTSTYPFMYTDYCPLPPQKKTIAEILKGHGYYNFCINSNIFLSKLFDFNRGFDEYVETRPTQSSQNLFITIRDAFFSMFPKDGRILRFFSWLDKTKPNLEGQVKITASELINEAMKFWKKTKRRKFGWMHFMDCHSPYNPPLEYITQENERITPARLVLLHKYQRALNRICDRQPHDNRSIVVDELLQLYRASLKYVDAEIGRFLDFISNNGDLNNTIIVITSDHGEMFMEHGFVEHPARMYDELLHVPLILRLPASFHERTGAPRSILTEVDLIHLAPTLLDLIGIQLPTSFCGKSLANLMMEGNDQKYYPILSQTYKKRTNEKTVESRNVERLISIQDSRWKFVHDTNNGCELKLFARKPAIDEGNDLAADYPDIVHHFKKYSNAILAGNYDAITSRAENYKIRDAIRKMINVH